jgi:nitroreductase
MLNDLSSPAALAATRRSGKPREMVAPGPDEAQLRRILTAAMRVPDHGKIAPWRFVVIAAEQRAAFAALLERAYRLDKPEPTPRDIETLQQFAHQAPTLVAVLSTPNVERPIPVWEQELSAGAACTAMLYAAHAEGYVGGWLTSWAAYSPEVAEGLGYPGARIAGFVFLGTPGKEPEERPRPDFDSIVSRWNG